MPDIDEILGIAEALIEQELLNGRTIEGASLLASFRLRRHVPLEDYDRKWSPDHLLIFALEKFEKRIGARVESEKQRPTSEGRIPKLDHVLNEDKPLELPTTPPKLWPGRPAGRPPRGQVDPLISFLRDVYGKYVAKFRYQLRDYIYRNDPKLYAAITNYERRTRLPADVELPTRRNRLQLRLEMAAAMGFDTLDAKARKSVAGRLARDERLKLGGPK